MGPVNARPLQDLRMNHREGNRIKKTRKISDDQDTIRTACEAVQTSTNTSISRKKGAYPKQVGDVKRYGEPEGRDYLCGVR